MTNDPPPAPREAGRQEAGAEQLTGGSLYDQLGGAAGPDITSPHPQAPPRHHAMPGRRRPPSAAQMPSLSPTGR